MPPATGTMALNNYLQAFEKDHLLSWVDVPQTSGRKGHPSWMSTCKYDGEDVATGVGVNKHFARDDAAEKALLILKSKLAGN
ncbi:hypothetical protein OF83DRAFT_1171223 [Amylostereum chailletii]|nr:hypothetical protein OF83DRAFT_1171223 [Amylostereum chailletii]